MPIAEGKQRPFDPPSVIDADCLELIDYQGNPQWVTYETREFSAVCPFSGLPDFGQFIMKYITQMVSDPFPAVLALHTSGGFRSINHLFQRYANDGFAVYVPDFFKSTVSLQERGWRRSALTGKTSRRNYQKSSN